MMETLAMEIAGHVPRMYRVAMRIVGNPDAAQEVAQDACVKALHGIDGFDGRAALATWLHRITINCAHDHVRKNHRIDRGRVEWRQETLGLLAAAEAGPAEQAEKNDAYRAALKLVAALPDDCRAAFMLTQLDGYTYDEAAAIESASRGTIASRVFRARQILIDQMNHRLDGEA
jgi:RNA polymerase sigma-70 factor (ECF subfamily)